VNSIDWRGDFAAWRRDAGAWLRDHGYELWIITGIWAALTVVIYLLAVGHESPRRYQDEFLFWGLAKNFAAGDGLTWRGQGLGMRSWLYPVLLAPAFWASGTVPGQYTGVHLINSMMICGTIFPAYLMSRLFLSRWLAFVPAILTVSVPAMNYAGIIGTENLAYFTFTAALGAILLALARPRPRNTLLAIAAIFVAALTRTQFIILLPVLLAVVLLVAAMREPGARSAYLREQKPMLIGLGVMFALGGLAFLVQGKGAVGLYGGVFDGIPLEFSALWFWIKAFSADIYLMTAVVPVIATLAMFGSAENRRDPLIGALLALSVVVTVALIAQVAWFSATNPYDWRARHIFYERYMFYVGPLYFLGLVASWRRVSVSAAVISVAAAVVVVSGFQTDAVLVPFSYDSFGLSLVGRHMGLHPESVAKIGMFLARVTLFIGIFYVISTVKREVVSRVFYWGVIVFTFVALVATQGQTWHYARLYSGQAFDQVPKPANFIDKNTDEDVGMLITSTDSPEMYFTSEFWNSRVTRAFATDSAPIKTPIMYSPKCTFDWDRTGQILGTGCDKVPNAWFMRSDTVTMHLQDETKRVHPAPAWPTLTLMVGEPPARILSLIDGRAVRTGVVQGTLNARTFLPKKGQLRVRIDAPKDTEIIKIGNNPSQSLSAGKGGTFIVDLPAEEKLTTITIKTPTGLAAPAVVSGLDVRVAGGKWTPIT
jgi:hypothetical protein